MAKLIYSAITSLDGYVADENGKFDWAAPDEEVHAFVNDLERPIGTYLLGRRMYDVMRYWDGDEPVTHEAAVMRDYAEIWRAADKVVYSRTLDETPTRADAPRARIRSGRGQADEGVAKSDLSVGGPELAGHALRAGLVDEVQLFLNPIVVGAAMRRCPAAFA